MASSRPLEECMERTRLLIWSSTSGGWWTVRLGPMATSLRSSSVSKVAISTITSVVGSSPVISRSSHASTPWILRAERDGPGVGLRGSGLSRPRLGSPPWSRFRS